MRGKMGSRTPKFSGIPKPAPIGRFHRFLRRAWILHTRVVAFKQGSQRKREVTTVAGATTIKTSVQLGTREGRTVVNREVEGKVRFFGENLNATSSLAKKIAKIIRQTFYA